ncbi:MAG: FAD-dependent oxidoreductase [Oscillospiraceae bacterium]|nr:FAD-dependent oxidoreductase [Oscillospiraceae bacterium]
MIEYSEFKNEYAPLYGEYDVVVCGGGMAGVGAAVAAGRAGAKTILIENTSALGGIATMGIVNIPLDFLSGLGQELFAELEKLGGLRKRNSDPEKHKLVFDRMVKAAGCDLLLVTPVIDAIVDGNTIKGVIVHTKEGRRSIMGKRFVDASGDSDLVYFAGGETEVGREKDHMSMGCSLEFVLGGVDFDKYRESELRNTDPKWIRFLTEAIAAGKLPDIDNHLNWMTHLPGRPEHCGMDEVSICFAHSRNCFPTKNEDLTRMYLEGREQVDILAKFLRENIPGFEHSYLSYTGTLLGVRESRRIVGKYRITGMDIAYAKHHDDVVAISYHGFDIHGFTASGNLKWFKGTLPSGEEAYISNIAGWGSQLPPDDGVKKVPMSELLPKGVQYYYDIPYRALVHTRLDNVLAAGRNLSSDVPGQSGTRLVMCCMAMGEAAGNACALSLKEGVPVGGIDVTALQRILIAHKCNIGQGFRKIPGIEDGDYSEYAIEHRARNG